MPHQSHDVATGVEIETAWFARWPHIGFVRKLIAFAAITGMTTGDQVFPGGEASARTRDHMVKREFAGGKRGAAILAGVAVTQQNVLPR